MSETNTGGGRGDGGPLGRIPEQVAQQATGIGRAFGDAVAPKAEDIANRSKSRRPRTAHRMPMAATPLAARAKPC
jgi:hypothetical protein